MANATVCVTGAGGFMATWVVQELLARGYTVHGTSRDPEAAKNAHLEKLRRAENLKLFKTDLLDMETLSAAVAGCDGVFHLAKPVVPTVQDPDKEILSPAVAGTLNVLKAAEAAKVRRVVIVSSTTSVVCNPRLPAGSVADEACWSDEDFCRSIKNWYALSKTAAEREARAFAERSGLDVVTVCPSFVYGPQLRPDPEISFATALLLNLIRDGNDAAAEQFKLVTGIVDVRDVADALILVHEEEQASGRYICSSPPAEPRELAGKLQDLYPEYSIPTSIDWSTRAGAMVSAKKLEALGWKSRPIDDILKGTVEFYRTAGVLPAARPAVAPA